MSYSFMYIQGLASVEDARGRGESHTKGTQTMRNTVRNHFSVSPNLSSKDGKVTILPEVESQRPYKPQRAT